MKNLIVVRFSKYQMKKKVTRRWLNRRLQQGYAVRVIR